MIRARGRWIARPGRSGGRRALLYPVGAVFVDALPPGRPYDCYVIGAGPAGITLALELARANRTVLVIESGPASGARDDLPNVVGYGHYDSGHWNEHSVRALGGASRVWSGWCLTLMERDFDNPVTGVRWPVSRNALLPYYRRAAEILGADPAIVDAEEPWHPGFVRRVIDRTRPLRFGIRYADELAKSSTIHVAPETSVVGIDANPSRTAVESLTCFHHRSEGTARIPVEPRSIVVVAGGGIGNAQLLLQPRSDGAVPVGNESGQVGRFLMEHPHFDRVAELVLDEQHRANAMAVVPDDDCAARHALLGSTAILHTPASDHPMIDYLSGWQGRRYWHYTCSVMSEMMPEAGNQVFLTGERDAAGFHRPAARCVFGARDLISVETTLRLLGEALVASGKGRIRILNERLYMRQGGGGHIMGTTRMGDSPSTSVVDRDCRVHGYDNLFVAGSSVFPTGGYANPTLTIVALTLRLADFLVAGR